MGRKRQQIDAECAHVDRNLSRRLHRVGVHHGAAFMCDLRDRGDILHRADLVVGEHDRHDRGLVVDRLTHAID